MEEQPNNQSNLMYNDENDAEVDDDVSQQKFDEIYQQQDPFNQTTDLTITTKAPVHESTARPVDDHFVNSLYGAWCDDTGLPPEPIHQSNNQANNQSINRSVNTRYFTLSEVLFEECSSEMIRLESLNLGPRCATAILNYLVQQDAEYQLNSINQSINQSSNQTHNLTVDSSTQSSSIPSPTNQLSPHPHIADQSTSKSVDQSNTATSDMQLSVKVYPVTLHTLILNSNQLESFGCVEMMNLVVKFPCIVRLEMRDCSIGPAGISELAAALAANKSLKFLDIGSTRSLDQSMSHSNNSLVPGSSRMIGRKSNHGDSNSLLKLCACLSINQSIESIGLRGLDLGLDSLIMNAFASSIKKNKIIQKLDLSDNSIGVSGLISLLNSIKEHTSLTSVDLSNNVIKLDTSHSQSIDQSIHLEAAALRSFASTNRVLQSIKLSRNPLGDSVVCSLVESLIVSSVDSSLTYLDLSHCSLTDSSCASLAGLVRSSKLSRLVLAHNSITGVGAAQIIRACQIDVSHNQSSDIQFETSSLVSLNLAGNPIERQLDVANRSEWYKALRTLAGNPRLAILDLTSCHLTDASVFALCDAINSRSNEGLKHARPLTAADSHTIQQLPQTWIQLKGNFFSSATGPALVESAQAAMWLARVDVRGSQISFDDRRALANICARHRRWARESEPRRLRKQIQALQMDEARLKSKRIELSKAHADLAQIGARCANIDKEAANFIRLHDNRRAAIDSNIERESDRVEEARARIEAKVADILEHEKVYEDRLEELTLTLRSEREALAALESKTQAVKEAIDDIVKVRPQQIISRKARLASLKDQHQHKLVQLTHVKREFARLQQCRDNGKLAHHLLVYAQLARQWLEYDKIQLLKLKSAAVDDIPAVDELIESNEQPADEKLADLDTTSRPRTASTVSGMRPSSASTHRMSLTSPTGERTEIVLIPEVTEETM